MITPNPFVYGGPYLYRPSTSPKQVSESDGKGYDDFLRVVTAFFYAPFSLLIGAYIANDAYLYQQDRKAYAYEELDFMGSDDPIIAALVLGTGVSSAITFYLIVKIYCFSDDTQAKKLEKTTENNMTVFWGLVFAMSIYGILRLTMGACLGPDNATFNLSSLGDVHNGESMGVAKVVSTALLYSGLFCGSSYMLYKEMDSKPVAKVAL